MATKGRNERVTKSKGTQEASVENVDKTHKYPNVCMNKFLTIVFMFPVLLPICALPTSSLFAYLALLHFPLLCFNLFWTTLICSTLLTCINIWHASCSIYRSMWVCVCVCVCGVRTDISADMFVPTSLLNWVHIPADILKQINGHVRI